MKSILRNLRKMTLSICLHPSSIVSSLRLKPYSKTKDLPGAANLPGGDCRVRLAMLQSGGDPAEPCAHKQDPIIHRVAAISFMQEYAMRFEEVR